MPKIREQRDVRVRATRAQDSDAVAADSLDNGKFAEPITKARERVFPHEASSLAAFQESPQLTL